MIYKKIIVALCISLACSSYCLDRFVYFDFDSRSKNSEIQALFSMSFCRDLSNVTIEGVWNEAIKDISGNEVGKGLIERLCTLLSMFEQIERIERNGHYTNIIKITAKEGGTLFSGGTYKVGNAKFGVQPSPMSISLNLDLLHDSIVWHAKHRLCSLIPAMKCHDGDYYATSVCCDPFWITVAHELIHMEHFLSEELNKYVCKKIFRTLDKKSLCTALKDSTKRSEILTEIKQLREIFSGDNYNVIDIIGQLPSLECSDIEFVTIPFSYEQRELLTKCIDAIKSIVKITQIKFKSMSEITFENWLNLLSNSITTVTFETTTNFEILKDRSLKNPIPVGNHK